MIEKIISFFVKNDKLVKPVQFVVLVLLSYLFWKVFSNYAKVKGSYFYDYWISFHDFYGSIIANVSAFILTYLFQYDLTAVSRNIIVNGYPGVFIANHCLGVAPMVIFTSIIVSYGGAFKKMLWFIPLGLFGIFFVNTLRVIALVFTQVNASEFYFQVGHSYVYVVLTYGIIFLFIRWWINDQDNS